MSFIKEPVDGHERCFCPKQVCVSAKSLLNLVSLSSLSSARSLCHYGDKSYKRGEEFLMTQNCTSSCTCEENGKTMCFDLCPPRFIDCPQGWKMIFNLTCSCPKATW